MVWTPSVGLSPAFNASKTPGVVLAATCISLTTLCLPAIVSCTEEHRVLWYFNRHMLSATWNLGRYSYDLTLVFGPSCAGMWVWKMPFRSLQERFLRIHNSQVLFWVAGVRNVFLGVSENWDVLAHGLEEVEVPLANTWPVTRIWSFQIFSLQFSLHLLHFCKAFS